MALLSPRDETLLRRTIALAEAAVDAGNRPFGALVADAAGVVIAEGYSTQQASRDWTAHGEMNALRAAGQTLSWQALGGATLYASGDPCPMCAAAAYWSNIRRVVFGVDEAALRPFRQGNAKGAGLALSCRDVLAAAPHAIEVIGPALVDEAIAPHRRYWGVAHPPEGWV